MWKVKVLTWRPILESASTRASFEKVEVLKVVVIDSNNGGAARDEKSWQTRRKLARSSVSRCSSRLSRQWSFSQKRKKTELVERTKLQIELFERTAGIVNKLVTRVSREGHLTSSVDSSSRR